MHQQFRIRLRVQQLDTPGAVPARTEAGDAMLLRPGALAELASAFEREGLNIRSIGGTQIELGGITLLAVDDDKVELADALLRRLELEFELVTPAHGDLQDRAGELARFAAAIADRNQLIDEIIVGTPNAPAQDPGEGFTEPGGAPTIPLQATTVAVGARLAPEDFNAGA